MALDVEVVQHSQFFDFLANLVQAKHYYDTDQELLNPKYMKKAAREEAKRSMKEQYTKNKKAKLNPDTAATTLSVQQRQAAGEQQEDEQPSSAPQAGLLSFASSSKQLSREELREKLRQKVEAMRSQRNLDELPSKQSKQKKTAQAAKEWRQKQLAMKQQQSDQQQERQQQQQHQRAQQQQKRQQQQNQQGKKQQKQDDGLKFGNLVIGQGNRPWDHKKKASKEELLKQAEAKKQQLAEAGQTAEGKVSSKKWYGSCEVAARQLFRVWRITNNMHWSRHLPLLLLAAAMLSCNMS
jgi:hypothetical protein